MSRAEILVVGVLGGDVELLEDGSDVAEEGGRAAEVVLVLGHRIWHDLGQALLHHSAMMNLYKIGESLNNITPASNEQFVFCFFIAGKHF